MKHLAIISLVALLYASSAALAAAPAKNILLGRGHQEPWVTVDPLHPRLIVVGSNPNYGKKVNGGFPNSVFVSTDGGRTFSDSTLPIRQPYIDGADPSLSVAESGTIFYSILGQSPGHYSCNGCVCKGTPGTASILVSRSLDRGKTFQVPTLIDANNGDDKPLSAIENIPGRKTHMFVVWTRWQKNTNVIFLSRSLDGGVTFGAPQQIYSSRFQNYAPYPVVGPDHRIYVFWSEFHASPLTTPGTIDLRVSISADDGASFSATSTLVSEFKGLPRMMYPGYLRALTGPTATVGPKGTVYVAWPAIINTHADGANDVDIQLSRSRNGGATWSAPVAVNDVHTGDRFFPSMTAFKDGSLGLAFYDRRAGPDNLNVYAVRAVFKHGFHASANVQVNDAQSSVEDMYYIKPGGCYAPGRFFGDYLSAAGCPHHTLCVAWADAQLHVKNESDIWFARVPLPRP